MIRRNLLSIAVLMAAGAVGCAHCDTCSDFPGPGNAPAYGGGGGMPVFGAAGVGDATPASLNTPANDAAPAAPSVPSTAPSIESKPAAPAAEPKPPLPTLPPKPGV